MRFHLQKAGANPNQALSAFVDGPAYAEQEAEEVVNLKVGDIIHVAGQPEDVRWKVMRIER
jgi:hypothetical protein